MRVQMYYIRKSRDSALLALDFLIKRTGSGQTLQSYVACNHERALWR